MHLIYFDENKYSTSNPFFLIGGILLEDKKITELENTVMQIQYNFFGTNVLNKDTEMHGVELFQGMRVFKGKKLESRINLFNDIATCLINHKVPIRMVCIDVSAHRKKYTYPQPEYNLGLMLILERFCDYLEVVDDIGVVFGDYEKDEVTRSILDFSQFKFDGKTSMYLGRPLGRLKDTIHFTHSHHSRFLQIADMIIYMAGRCENSNLKRDKWHDVELQKIWEKLKNNTNYSLQRWPKQGSDQSQLRGLAEGASDPSRTSILG